MRKHVPHFNDDTPNMPGQFMYNMRNVIYHYRYDDYVGYCPTWKDLGNGRNTVNAVVYRPSFRTKKLSVDALDERDRGTGYKVGIL